MLWIIILIINFAFKRNILRPDKGVVLILMMAACWFSFSRIPLQGGFLQSLLLGGCTLQWRSSPWRCGLVRPILDSRILPTVHFPLMALLSAMVTTSFTCRFLLSVCHFFRATSARKTSLAQRFQNESTIFWTNSTLCRGFCVSRNGPWGTLDEALPSNMSFGDRYAPSSGSFGTRPIGRWLTRLATSSRQVYSSSGVRICCPMAFFNAILQLLTKASAQPFWCGAAGVMNLHSMPFSAQ